MTVRLTRGLGKGSTDASQTKDAADGCSRDGFEGLAAGSTGRQGLRQVIKSRGVHCRLLLSQRTGRTSDAQSAPADRPVGP